MQPYSSQNLLKMLTIFKRGSCENKAIINKLEVGDVDIVAKF